jgi:hypothetical protein
MRDYKVLEDLISSGLERYKIGFNTMNPDYEADFFSTLTEHQVEHEGVKKWVAYLRVEKAIRPKGGTDEEWEHLLIYNQAYKFKNIGERTDANAPWKFDLFLDCLQRLIAGGVEYAELIKRMQTMSKGKEGQPISQIVQPEEPKIIVTDKMPAPLSNDDKAYLEWVKKQKR